MGYRKYRTQAGAGRYVAKLNAQLAQVNASRAAAGKPLSGVDFYHVGNDPQGFGFVALVTLQNGKTFCCA